MQEGLFRVDARMNVDDFAEIFDIDLEDEDDIHTVGGLLAKELGQVPIQGSEVEVQGLILHAETLEGRRNRVARLLVRQTEDSTGQIRLDGYDDATLQGAHGTFGSTTDSREGR